MNKGKILLSFAIFGLISCGKDCNFYVNLENHNLNRIDGPNNKIHGKDNQVHGKDNHVKGDVNKLHGNTNNIKGHKNKITGDGNSVGITKHETKNHNPHQFVKSITVKSSTDTKGSSSYEHSQHPK